MEMGQPGKFPTNTGGEISTVEQVDKRIASRLKPLAEGAGRLVLLMVPGRQAFASSKHYQTSTGDRRLFVITERGEIKSYLDVALDKRAGVAVCKDNSGTHAPREFGNLGKLCPERAGFACGEDEKMGNLLIGLALYTLRIEGINILKMVEYVPNEKDEGAFALAGPQRADFNTHVYRGVTDEIRQNVADALKIR